MVVLQTLANANCYTTSKNNLNT